MNWTPITEENEILLNQERTILEATEEVCRVMESAKIRRSDLARALGCSPGNVSQILSGRNINLRTMSDMASALGCRVKIRLVPLISRDSLE